MPEQIPIGLYTHINFAFGTINPFTYVVEANDEEGKLMYERLIALKRRDRNLKIFLAIGGWTFNDPGRTHKVFSNLVNSEGNQQKFLVSLMSFMALHKFDGLDLDWEYPVDKDRGGMESDYENFPKFMSNLKDLMEDGDRGLTITLPASYWYLQYFDIKKLVGLSVAEIITELTMPRNAQLTSSTSCPTTCTAFGTSTPTGQSPISTLTPTSLRSILHWIFFGATTSTRTRLSWASAFTVVHLWLK